MKSNQELKELEREFVRVQDELVKLGNELETATRRFQSKQLEYALMLDKRYSVSSCDHCGENNCSYHRLW